MISFDVEVLYLQMYPHTHSYQSVIQWFFDNLRKFRAKTLVFEFPNKESSDPDLLEEILSDNKYIGDPNEEILETKVKKLILNKFYKNDFTNIKFPPKLFEGINIEVNDTLSSINDLTELSFLNNFNVINE